MKRSQLAVILALTSSLLAGCSGTIPAQPGSQTVPGTKVAETTMPITLPGTQPTLTDPLTGGSTQPEASTTPAATTAPQTTPAATTAPATTTPATTPAATKSEAELAVEAWGNKIYPGVKVSGVKLGGLTAQEAETKLAQTVERVLDRKIPFTVYGKKYSPTQKKLGLSIQYKKALAKAVAAYDDASLAKKAAALHNEPDLNFKVTLKVDDDKLAAYVKNLAEDTYRKATTKVEGRSLLKKTLQVKLEDAIRFSSKSPSSFKASVKTTPKIKVSTGSVQPGMAVVGKGSSRFAESEVERSKNIRVATKRLNGVVIQPGETLSVLRVIKAPNLANGYYMSKVYSGDSLVDGTGGGVCQVSSTLYNAVLRAGLKIVDRSTHRFSVFYLPYGMDATIYAPSTDFQFKNTLDHPITIKGTAISGKLTFSLISDEDAMNGYSYKFYQTNIVEGDKHWRIEYTSQLDKGEEEILVYPHPKASVKVYRKTYRYGKLIKTEFWDAVSYRELVGVKRVGN